MIIYILILSLVIVIAGISFWEKIFPKKSCVLIFTPQKTTGKGIEDIIKKIVPLKTDIQIHTCSCNEHVRIFNCGFFLKFKLKLKLKLWKIAVS